MKKIMFSDKFGLTQAVLEGRKTMTRRICKEQVWSHSDIVNAENGIFHFEIPRYKVGEVVAIAQSYKEVAQGGYPVDSRYDAFRTANWGDGKDGVLNSSAGWGNKLFVASSLMPHHIRITDIEVERLQDISDDDFLKEGISFIDKIKAYYFDRSDIDKGFYYYTAKHAFAALIDKVSGNGVWESNPFVFVYEFELVD